MESVPVLSSMVPEQLKYVACCVSASTCKSSEMWSRTGSSLAKPNIGRQDETCSVEATMLPSDELEIGKSRHLGRYRC